MRAKRFAQMFEGRRRAARGYRRAERAATAADRAAKDAEELARRLRARASAKLADWVALVSPRAGEALRRGKAVARLV